jgi:hypothetical protein
MRWCLVSVAAEEQVLTSRRHCRPFQMAERYDFPDCRAQREISVWLPVVNRDGCLLHSEHVSNHHPVDDAAIETGRNPWSRSQSRDRLEGCSEVDGVVCCFKRCRISGTDEKAVM